MKYRFWIAVFVLLVPVCLLIFHSNWGGNSRRGDLLSLIKPLEVVPHQTGIEGIDCAYCINLDVRKEKWESMQQKLAAQGIKANRFSAINGWEEITREHIKKIQKPYKAGLNRGRIGCLLSHLSVLNDAKNQNFNHILILEDDVDFIADMKAVSSYLGKLSSLDTEWDILFLDDWNLVKNLGNRPPEDRPGSTMSEIIKKPKQVIQGTPFIRTYYRHGAYAMIVSKKGIEKIYNYFAHTPVFFAYDLEFNHINNIKMYETDHDFVTVDGNISDTSNKPLKSL